jgi:succinate dehydrogenase / fumarate reductase cytochrome b subunit
MTWALRLWQSTIGKKVVMALTGFALFGFVIVHMLGNLQVFAPAKTKVDAAGKTVVDTYGKPVQLYPIDEYGHMLKSKPLVLWGARSFLLLCVGLHVVVFLQLRARNSAARPEPYSGRTWREASLPARLMYLTGPMILLFIIYHLLHFTTGQAHTGFQDGNVHHNVVHAFTREWWAVAVYIVANVLLGAHLSHGGWSMFQSLGVNHPRWTPIIKICARLVAGGVTAGNVLMPILVAAGVGR